MADITTASSANLSALIADTTSTKERSVPQVEQLSDKEAFTEQASSAIAKTSLRILHDVLIRGGNVDDETALFAKGPFDVLTNEAFSWSKDRGSQEAKDAVEALTSMASKASFVSTLSPVRKATVASAGTWLGQAASKATLTAEDLLDVLKLVSRDYAQLSTDCGHWRKKYETSHKDLSKATNQVKGLKTELESAQSTITELKARKLCKRGRVIVE